MSAQSSTTGTAGTAARANAQGLAHVQLLDVRQVAELLCISVPTVWRYVKQERIPQPVRISASVIRWRLRDIERFLGVAQVA